MLRAAPRSSSGGAFFLAATILDHPRRLRPRRKDQAAGPLGFDGEAASAEGDLVEETIRSRKGCDQLARARLGGQASVAIAGPDDERRTARAGQDEDHPAAGLAANPQVRGPLPSAG